MVHDYTFNDAGTAFINDTITWAPPAAIDYGTALGSTQLDATSSVPGTLTYTPANGTVLSAGTHALLVTLTPSSHDFNYANASVSLTVKRATLTITPTGGQSKVYGAAVPTLTYTPSGFVNGDSSALLSGGLATAATAASPVGTYAFTLGTLSAGNNYKLALSANPPTFAVTLAPLSITPNAGQAKVYGAAVPVLTYTPSGFVNGDSATLLSGALGTTATAASPVGTYPFTLGTLSAGTNYTVALPGNPPTIAVTPAPLTASRVPSIRATAGAPFSGTVATFMKVSPNTIPYTAVID